MKAPTSRTVCLAVLISAMLTGALTWSATPPASAAPDDGQILAQFQREHGFIPKALRLLAQRPEALPRFMSYGKGVFEGGPLNERERYLVALSAAVALKSPDCIQAHGRRARQAGATDEEIVQTALVAGLVSNGSVLHTAYDRLAATRP
jgi:AhpD family alkylhydroperoxidase